MGIEHLRLGAAARVGVVLSVFVFMVRTPHVISRWRALVAILGRVRRRVDSVILHLRARRSLEIRVQPDMLSSVHSREQCSMSKLSNEQNRTWYRFSSALSENSIAVLSSSANRHGDVRRCGGKLTFRHIYVHLVPSSARCSVRCDLYRTGTSSCTLYL